MKPIEYAQMKISVPIAIKESIKEAANAKGMTVTNYFLFMHEHNIEQPMYSNAEQTAAIRNIGFHINNALQSLQLGCDKITQIELKEALKNYEALI